MSLKVNILVTFSILTILMLAYYLVTQVKENRMKSERLHYLTNELLANREHMLHYFDSGDQSEQEDDTVDETNCCKIMAVDKAESESESESGSIVEDSGDPMIIDQE